MKSPQLYELKAKQSLKQALEIFETASIAGEAVGIAVIVDEEGRVVASVTDGDIRRAILAGKTLDTPVEEVATYQPITFQDGISFREILEHLPTELAARGRKSKKYLGKIIMLDEEGKLVRILQYHQLWEQRVATHRHVVVLGLGYVGLTLAAVLAEEGFLVTGVDADPSKVASLKKGESYVFEHGLTELIKEQAGKNLLVNEEIPEDGDVYIIAVGTPVAENGSGEIKPIMDYIETVSQQVAQKLKQGNLVVLRSTVPIGTSREVVKPLLEKYSGLKCGVDFHLAFAPERTAEGKALKELRSLPQIIGGYNEESVEATAALFRELTPTLVRVSSLEAAEMVKLINNTFRDLIFAYANQVTQIAQQFNVDIFEIIKAANQGYPRDRVPLPSPGVGGPCLTKDPYIFSQVARTHTIHDTLFEQGRQINESMHENVVNRLEEQLRQLGKNIRDTRILVCGLAFKGYPETGDIRHSSGVEIYHLLRKRAEEVYGHDPVATQKEIIENDIKPLPLYEGAKGMDAILFLNNNPFYDKLDIFKISRMMADRPILLDGWNLFRSEEFLSVRPAVYMGLSNVISSI